MKGCVGKHEHGGLVVLKETGNALRIHFMKLISFGVC
jgi:hypothetical protein